MSNTKSFSILFVLLLSVLSVMAQSVAVSVTPAAPFSNQDLNCGPVSSQYTYKWFNNGYLYSDTIGPTLSNALTTHSDVWKCEVWSPSTTSVIMVGGRPVVVNNPAAFKGSNEVTILNAAPAVSTNGPYVGVENQTNIAFIGTAFDNIDFDAITSYAWDFGDGNSANTQNANHVYQQNGTYVVTFNATDAYGAMNSTTTVAVIGDTTPFVNFSISQNPVNEGTQVNFTDLSTAYDMPLTYSWNFGDASPLSTIQNATHTYMQNGTYNVVLTVTDNDGSINSTTQTIVVNDLGPFANFSASSLNIVEGNSVTFTDLSTSFPDTLAVITPLRWDFGDGQTSTASNPTHVYAQNGTYVVNLTVTDSDGSVNVSAPITIVVNDTVPTAKAAVLNLTLNEGQPMEFTGSGSTGYDQPLSYSWDFGDGSPLTTGVNVSHIYAQNGTYNTTLTVTDADGSVSTNTLVGPVDFAVLDTVPFANFSASNYNALTGEQINFTDLSTAYDLPMTFSWDFGDASTSTIENATHAYAVAGNYTVTLTVTDFDGSIASTSQNISVTNIIIPPVNDTSAPIISNLTVSVNNESAIINWTTDDLADSAVNFGLTTALGTPVTDGTFVTAHSLVLNGLLNGTGYNFNATSCNVYANCTSIGSFLFTTTQNSTFVPVVPTNSTNSTNTTNLAPVVSLETADNVTFTSAAVSLGYNVSDDTAAVLACTLNINSIANQTNASVANATSNTFGVTLADGTYTWNVACNDGLQNGISATQSFTINTTLPAVHDVLNSKAYVNNVNGVRLSNATGSNVTGNLTQGQVYTIGYRTDNNGTATESVTIVDTVTNATGAIVFTNSHTHSINAGANVADNTDSWDTTSLASGTYTILVNATINGFADVNLANNIGTRTITLQSNGTIIIPPVNDTTAPATISGLIATAITNSSITWNWTNPADVDFANAIVYFDGNNVVNTTAQTYTASGLLNNTQHTITIHTIDLTGNVNATDVNDTQFTLQNNGTIIIPPVNLTNNIFDSTINGVYYLANASSQVTSIPINNASFINASTLTVAVAITNSDIERSTVIANSLTRCTILDSNYNNPGHDCVDEFVDPSTIISSNTTGSTVKNSTITTSTATFSNITRSNLTNVDVTRMNIVDSIMNGYSGSGSTITSSNATCTTPVCAIINSTVTGSDLTNSNILTSTITNSDVSTSTINNSIVDSSTISGSTVTNSVVTGSNVSNSQITNSNIVNSTVTNSNLNNVNALNSTIDSTTISNVNFTNANVSNGNLISGNVTIGNNTYTGPIQGIIPVPPVAQFTYSVSNLHVDFTDLSTDANNDIVNWTWNFGDGNTVNGTQNPVSDYGSAGTYMVTLTTIDRFNLTNNVTYPVTVSIPVVTPPTSGSGGSSGGGSGGGTFLSQVSNASLIQGQQYKWDLEKDGYTFSKSLRQVDSIIFVYQGTSYAVLVDSIAGEQKVSLRISPTGEKRVGYKGDEYNFNIKDRVLTITNQGVDYDHLDVNDRVNLRLSLGDAKAGPGIAGTISTTPAKVADGIIKIAGEIAPPQGASVPVGIGITVATIVIGLLLFLGVRKIWQ